MSRRFQTLVTLIVIAVTTTANAEYQPGGGTAFDQALRTFAIDNSINRPSLTPDSSQDAAPAGSEVASSIVNKAGSTSLLAVALDSSLVSMDDKQAVTLNLNLFALLAAQDPSILADKEQYARHKTLRRFSGSVTFGGASPEMVERDADSDEMAGEEMSSSPTTESVEDSTAEERPASLLDVVTVRGEWRILGSRDRRDYFDRYKRELTASRDALASSTDALLLRPGLAGDFAAAKGEAGQYETLLRYMRNHPEDTKAVIAAYSGVEAQLDALNTEIDKSFLLTLAGTGEARRDGMGSDKFDLELIGEGVLGSIDFAGNLCYRWEQKDGDERDEELRLALGVSRRMLTGTALVADGLDTSLSVSGQLRNNDREDILSINAGLDFPLGNGLKIPLSITWASRADLVDESYVRGNFGISYDLSAFKRN